MTNGEFFTCLHKDDSGIRRSLMGACGFLLVLVVVGCWLFWYVNQENSRWNMAENTVNQQTEFIVNYEQREREFRESFLRRPQPVSVQKLDQVQNGILRQAKDLNLNVVSLMKIAKSVQPNEVVDGQEYELNLVGQWKASAQFVEELLDGPALISIRSLRMEPEPNGSIKTLVKYKVYMVGS